jgi:DNA-binding CsgD family transcriptional regulator
MLQGGFMSVLQARSRDELRDEVVRFAAELGFDTVAATAAVERPLADPEVVTVDNTPQAYHEAFEDPVRARGRVDPVMQHIKRQSVPIIWDQATYVREGQGELWEEQARYGYRNGIALALHLPEGRHFLLGVDRDQPVPAHKGELTRVVADLQLFAVLAQDVAMRVLLTPPPPSETPSLTPRELECLRWTMDGKTAWEVGSILGISERTAVLHTNNAMHKLGCVNKHQAVIKALRLGLIR